MSSLLLPAYPGDPVIGIKSPDGTVTVHKKSCPVADSIASKHGDWVVVPQWEDDDSQSFPVLPLHQGS